MSSIYWPAEDSYLLQKYVMKHVAGLVLDMGVGSGIQAIAAASKKLVKFVIAVDIDPTVLDFAKQRAAEEGVSEKIEFRLSNLYQNVHESFDWIIFNPPYLASEPGVIDPTWDGGKSGSEILNRFLLESKGHLNQGGAILLVYSSETEVVTTGAGYNWEILEEVNAFFEKIFCAKITPF